MCLATAYRKKNSPENVICEYVTKVQVDNHSVILTDIMNNTTLVEGTLSEINLEHNTIIIEVLN